MKRTAFATAAALAISAGLAAQATSGSGACCFPDEDICFVGTDQADCQTIGGEYLGYGLTCHGDSDDGGPVVCDAGGPPDSVTAGPGFCRGCGSVVRDA